MPVAVLIPTPLRQYAEGARELDVEGHTVDSVLKQVMARYPRLGAQLYAGDGLRSFVNVFVNEENIRDLGGDGAAVTPGDVVSIIPSIAGG